mgnify:CR=1 FL=1
MVTDHQNFPLKLIKIFLYIIETKLTTFLYFIDGLFMKNNICIDYEL